jgi:hypothetical protein
MDKLEQYPYCKKPDYDWDIISIIDNAPDFINADLE